MCLLSRTKNVELLLIQPQNIGRLCQPSVMQCFLYQDSTFVNPYNMKSVLYMFVHKLHHIKVNGHHCAASQSHSLRLWTCQPDPAVFGSMSRLLRGQTFLDVSKAIRELACMAGFRQKRSARSTKDSTMRHPCRIFCKE